MDKILTGSDFTMYNREELLKQDIILYKCAASEHISVISTTYVSQAVGWHYGTLPLSMAYRGRLRHWPTSLFAAVNADALCKTIKPV